MDSQPIVLDRKRRYYIKNREEIERRARVRRRCERSIEMAGKIRYMDIKKEVSKLTYEIFHDLLSDDGYYQYPNFTPVAFLLNEATLEIKSGYEYDDIVSNGGDGLQDVFGIDIREQDRLDFEQELPAGSETRKQAIKAIGKLVTKGNK
ncbi:hypothetical protein INT45_002774 [Circinella minor]|uniref:Uncharacterized protein n=1 Tax=Circinella minor TaxID=1195481 RepID=A0A8H7R659_9FUNG|nr:hypothetical protein INT45_002774 [Circinella minor]